METARQRWADDGGFIPEDETLAPVSVSRPWAAVGIAASIGFVVGWLTARR
jgi:hypothetical protein